MPAIVADGGLDVDALVFHHRSEYRLQANWKVLVENFLECYHCAVAHPGLADVIDVDQNAYRLERHPTFASHFAHVRERPRDARYDAAGIDGQFHLVWPSLKVNVMPGRANLSIGPLTPVTPGCTDGVLDYFFAPDEDPAWIADFMALDDEVGAEDRGLVESVQRGMAAGVFAHGELLLPSEDLIAAFQRWVADGFRTRRAGTRASTSASDPLAVLVGVEAMADDELRGGGGHLRVGVDARAPRAAAERRAALHAHARRQRIAVDDAVGRDVGVVHLDGAVDQAAMAADVPLEAQLVRAGGRVVLCVRAVPPGSIRSTSSGADHSGGPNSGSSSARGARVGCAAGPVCTVIVTGSATARSTASSWSRSPRAAGCRPPALRDRLQRTDTW